MIIWGGGQVDPNMDWVLTNGLLCCIPVNPGDWGGGSTPEGGGWDMVIGGGG